MNTLDTVAALKPPQFESWLVVGACEENVPNLCVEAVDRGVRILFVPDLVREISPYRDIKAWLHLVRILRWGRFDVLHTHTSKAGILGRAAAVWIHPRPAIVHSPHGHVFYGYFGKTKSFLFMLLERCAGWVTDRMIVLTTQGMRDHEKLGIMPATRMQVIPSGVDMKRFRDAESVNFRERLGLSQGSFLVGSVGRLVEVKGHIYLIRAVADLDDVHVILIGEGALEERLRLEAARLGIQRRLHLLGFSEQIPELLKGLDLFVLPSLNEGMGRALVEAMASGLPCVATRVGGVVDLIQDGITGLLVPSQDEMALSKAIQNLMKNPQKRASLGTLARQWVGETYSREYMVNRIASLYHQVVKEKNVKWKEDPCWKSFSQDKDCW